MSGPCAPDSATYLLTGYQSIEIFHCEIHGMVPLLQITMSPFYRSRKWGWGQLYAGMDGDGDDPETSCGDKGGMGIRVLQTVGVGINICPRASL